MRIAMIGAKGIPASAAYGGGIESHVEILSRRLAEEGHRVTVYVRPYTNPARKRTWQGVRLITLPTWRRKNLETIVHVFFASVHVLFQDVDLIHYHGVGPATMAWIPRVFRPRCKVVVTFHSRDRFHAKWGWFAQRYLALGEWATCAFPHLTIAVSHNIKLYCHKRFQREAVYLPNGVDIPSRIPGTNLLPSLGVEPGEYIVTLGRLAAFKGQDETIRAFTSLSTKKKLLIIGDATYDNTDYSHHLESLAVRDPRIRLMGRRSGEELAQLLAHCYCMVHSSKIEGLSIAVLEVMSYGRMVIMSDIPGNLELVDHSGVAYPAGHVQALHQALAWALSDPALVRVRGERAREVAKRLYSWDRIVARLQEEYKNV